MHRPDAEHRHRGEREALERAPLDVHASSADGVAIRVRRSRLEILDVGAGTGALTAHLAERSPRARFTVLDVDAAMLSRVTALAKATRQRWAAHLVANGVTEARAYARFDEWAKEDRYFSIEEEIDMLRTAGFRSAEVVWRTGPCAVMVAI